MGALPAFLGTPLIGGFRPNRRVVRFNSPNLQSGGMPQNDRRRPQWQQGRRLPRGRAFVHQAGALERAAHGAQIIIFLPAHRMPDFGSKFVPAIRKGRRSRQLTKAYNGVIELIRGRGGCGKYGSNSDYYPAFLAGLVVPRPMAGMP